MGTLLISAYIQVSYSPALLRSLACVSEASFDQQAHRYCYQALHWSPSFRVPAGVYRNSAYPWAVVSVSSIHQHPCRNLLCCIVNINCSLFVPCRSRLTPLLTLAGSIRKVPLLQINRCNVYRIWYCRRILRGCQPSRQVCSIYIAKASASGI